MATEDPREHLRVEDPKTEDPRIERYRSRSFQYLENAYSELRRGKWSRSEELLWGSLSLAVKGVALSQGKDLQEQEEIQAYATRLGQDWRDRRIRDAFSQLSKFGEAAQRARESRYRIDRLSIMLDDLRSAVEQLWAIARRDESE